jgi:hypothetical protein
MALGDASADTVAAEKFLQQLQHITEDGGYSPQQISISNRSSVLEKDGYRDLHLLRGQISTCI